MTEWHKIISKHARLYQIFTKHVVNVCQFALEFANPLGPQYTWISKLKYSWDCFTISMLPVLNGFIKKRFTVKSKDCSWDLVNGQTSSPYIKTGMHLLTNNCITTSSLAAIMITTNNKTIFNKNNVSQSVILKQKITTKLRITKSVPVVAVTQKT